MRASNKILCLIAINALILIGFYVLVEAASFGMIALQWVPLPPNAQALLLSHFPVQLRPLDPIEASTVYGLWAQPDEKMALPLSDSIDTELWDVRPMDMEVYHNGKILRMEWMHAEPPLFLTEFWKKHDTQSFDRVSRFFKAVRKELAPGSKLLVAMGGSTTAFTVNWPFFLSQTAQRQGQDVVVVNLGQAGWVVKDYNRFFTPWYDILVQGFGRKPDALLSLSGTNDLALYAVSYTDYMRGTLAFWNPNRTVYEMVKMKNDIYAENHPFINVLQHLGDMLGSRTKTFMTHLSVRLFPYTTAMLKPSDETTLAADKETGVVELPADVQDQLISGFEGRLRAFHGNLMAHHICHVSFLQPMALPALYPFNPERKDAMAMGWKTIAYMPKSLHMGGPAGGNYSIAPEEYFLRSRSLYRRLNLDFPGSFIDISDAFYNTKSDLYSQDSIHYSAEGSQIIADAIFKEMQQRFMQPCRH